MRVYNEALLLDTSVASALQERLGWLNMQQLSNSISEVIEEQLPIIQNTEVADIYRSKKACKQRGIQNRAANSNMPTYVIFKTFEEGTSAHSSWLSSKTSTPQHKCLPTTGNPGKGKNTRGNATMIIWDTISRGLKYTRLEQRRHKGFGLWWQGVKMTRAIAKRYRLFVAYVQPFPCQVMEANYLYPRLIIKSNFNGGRHKHNTAKYNILPISMSAGWKNRGGLTVATVVGASELEQRVISIAEPLLVHVN
jgi:hypothetical protein